MSISIGKKISLAFSIILVLILLMGITVYTLNAGVKTNALVITEDDVPGVILYLKILGKLEDMHSNVLEYTTGESDELEEFKLNHQDFRTLLEQLRPLESDTDVDVAKLKRIEFLVRDYINIINKEVFLSYNPDVDIWARKRVDDLEHNQGRSLEFLLDSLKENEYEEALKTHNLDDALGDDLPGVRYYLELVDEAGDMLASLSEYVGGELDEKEEFELNAKDFEKYLRLLEPLEQKPQEIRDLINISRLYTVITDTADDVFNNYDPSRRTQALSAIDRLEHTTLRELEEILTSSSNEEQKDARDALYLLVSTLSTINLFIFGLVIISMILSVTITIWVTNTIMRAVGGEPEEIEKLASQVALGDINLKIESSSERHTGIYAALIDMIAALKEKVRITEKAAQGDLKDDITLISDLDVLGKALQQMQLNFRDIVEEANGFAAGDYNRKISPRSANDELGIALLHMMQQVTDRVVEVEEQNYNKTKLSTLTDIAARATDMPMLAQSVLSEIAKVLSIGQGVFYVLEKIDLVGTDVHHDKYVLLGSYAYKERKNLSNSYRLGEGLVGQSALEKEIILLTSVPENYIHIHSGLGEAEPLNILVQPILYENRCIGVLELASFKAFTPQYLELLDQLAYSLGVNMNNLSSKQRISELLSESQTLAQESQAQQDKLKISNEELASQKKQLEQSKDELQIQQNALKRSNEDLERKQVEISDKNDELEKSRKILEEKSAALALSSKYKSEFLANMSHELRTPLNSLLILSQTLADNKEGNLSEKQIKAAQIINEGGKSLLEMINDILDLSKVEAGKLDINLEEVYIQDSISNLTSLFDPVAKQKNLNFYCSVDDDVPEFFISDSHRMEQILRNFLSNALKFTDAGSVTVHVHRPDQEVTFSCESLTADSCIGITVTDTGVGINKEKVHIIFEAFQQQDGSVSRKYGGTGLGLTISRELTRILGGEIQVHSELGKGSEFTLYLPLQGPEDMECSSQYSSSSYSEKDSLVGQQDIIQNQFELTPIVKTQEPSTSADLSNLRSILVIEDDVHFSEVLRNIIEDAGFECLLSGTGYDGLYMASHFLPLGILLDIGLPDMNGFEVLSKLKESDTTKMIPVHVLSSDNYQTDSMEHGALDFTMKPISEEMVKKALSGLNVERLQQLEKILIVEDEANERVALEALFAPLSVAVYFAETGEEAIQKMSNIDFDCVVLDLGLPDMTGHELLLHIAKDSDYKPRVIVHTGKELEDEQREEISQYCADVVIKGPESPQRLLADIEQFLRGLTAKDTSEDITFEAGHEDKSVAGRRILLVDDDMRNTYALSSKLEEEGMDVVIADSGKSALEVLDQDANIELILMDIMMPEMDGFEAMEIIRKRSDYQNIPIIALTAKAMAEDRIACLNAGASEYLTKPIDVHRLIAMIKLFL
ncbi:response regulator [Vibrio sp. Of7-15]|uniref:response regulator n=1 Tax=Vibrio sp. Of7-15 TaxID=2724879 RepID=UPI001EF25531|nr:response regulator [Vibrio sp. Of7-15]MCG7497947.1 response regulator [Vibrio sp. Of7-15]